MKKIIAALLALALCLSVVFSASAAAKVYTFKLFGRTWSFSIPYRESATGQTTTAPKQTTKQNVTTAKATTKAHSTTRQATTKPQSTAAQSTYALSTYEKEVIRLINVIRVQNGLSTLSANISLSRVARLKSQDMQAKGYFSHTSPTYGSPFEMMKRFGISYRYAGENIAYGQRTPEQVVEAWMNSPGHRANILNANFTQIGMGYVASGNYWTQMFIG